MGASRRPHRRSTAPASIPEWYIEDFRMGDRFTTMARTVTEADLATYIGFTGFFEEVFLNVPMAVAVSVFKRRVVPGILVLAMAEGLFSLTGRLNKGIAFLGLSNLEIKSPTAIGDTISVELVVRSTRLTRQEGRGILEVAHTVRVDKERVAMEYVSTRMLASRPATPKPSSSD
jgi:acyl dehydratase